ncbi:hypothetical protein SASPL_151642 [Salvia splendens]|uniref:BHLH domain-containing protein n=1 Tax=Salvia splendens TaxID=180675 RepID=A0A8X8W8Q2_SALSN|nr:transcription factor bHLH120-like [Salvia splendens]KAG6390160.1 hypothetical protein SASPL_151642 [Salvia splendens]
MFQFSSGGGIEEPSTCFDEDKFVQDLLLDFPTPEGKNNLVGNKKRSRIENNEGDKTAPRLIEKQRRQEMTSLYASLRSLLPLQYVKGKRAVSDHMEQAVNYVNDMHKKIDELKRRRDMLKKPSSSVVGDGSQSSNSTNTCVEIKVLADGLMEIFISSSSNIQGEGFPLSKVLEDLLKRELNVIDCVFTRDARCCLNKIHIQLNDSTSIDLSELREGLVNVIRLA